MTVEEMQARIIELKEENMSLEDQISELESTRRNLDNMQDITIQIDRRSTDIIPDLLNAISGGHIENSISPVLTSIGQIQRPNQLSTLNEIESNIRQLHLRIQYNHEEIRNLEMMTALQLTI